MEESFVCVKYVVKGKYFIKSKFTRGLYMICVCMFRSLFVSLFFFFFILFFFFLRLNYKSWSKELIEDSLIYLSNKCNENEKKIHDTFIWWHKDWRGKKKKKKLFLVGALSCMLIVLIFLLMLWLIKQLIWSYHRV